MPLPRGTSKVYTFDVPAGSYAEGKLELRFIRAAGANAVVSEVKVWSTDKRALASPVGPRGIAWPAVDPVEIDWSRQDAIRGWPTFDWRDPEQEVAKQVVPAMAELLDRGARMLRDFACVDCVACDRGQATKDCPLARTRQELAGVTQRLASMRKQPAEAARDAWLKLYSDARWAVRRLALANPLLDFDELLFVRRHHAHYMHQCARRLAAATKPGGGICILRGLQPNGEVREITEGVLPRGAVSRPDLSFDAKRVLFGYGAGSVVKTDFC